eukprot:scaffold101846_cov60-Phaeocystis_antarctica.AAC.2
MSIKLLQQKTAERAAIALTAYSQHTRLTRDASVTPTAPQVSFSTTPYSFLSSLACKSRCAS